MIDKLILRYFKRAHRTAPCADVPDIFKQAKAGLLDDIISLVTHGRIISDYRAKVLFDLE